MKKVILSHHQNGDKWRLKNCHFITLAEVWLNWEGQWKSCRVAGRQTDLFAPVELLPTAEPRSGSRKNRKTPSPPAYLISASTTQEHSTLCVLAEQAKYKTTGRNAAYIIRDSCFIFHVKFGIILCLNGVINHSYFTENRRHA